MTVKSKADILSSIAADMADNNAGLISAEDVRNNMTDTVDSMNSIIASGDHDVAYPFINNVRSKKLFITESGVQFPTGTQYEHFPGAAGISHNTLGGLTTGDPHTQYLPVGGTRPMTSGLPMGDGNWINESGHPSRGLRFEYGDSETIHVAGSFNHSDGSTQSSAKGVASAWINFDGSGVSHLPVVNASHNIDSITRLDQGKYQIYFTSGTLMDNYYVAMGNSNSTTSASSKEDFDLNTVGLVLRAGDDASALRSITYVVRNDNGEYVDSELNDLVVFGHSPGTTADSSVTVS
jgi:hypothetical protein